MNKLTLRDLCFESKRLSDLTDDEFAAFKKELGAIELNGIEGYFIDLLQRGIAVENTANSIVAYLIGLTNKKPVDTIDYKGGTLPDIDVDFADTQRDQVIEYVVNKYGPDHVAGIGTYSLMWAKAAVRFTGKALGYEQDLVDRIAKTIPEPIQGKAWHIDEALAKSKDLQSIYNSDPRVKDIVDWAGKIDGAISARSQHAAGIVISADPISKICPVWKNDNNFPILEFNLDEAEKFGLVKMDFLGLRTLSIIKDAIDLINKRYNASVNFSEIPLDDPKTYDLLSTGKLLGVFQLEGSGISNYTMKFAPRSIMDVTLISAGYRPGPIQFLNDILAIRHGIGEPKMTPTSEKFPIISPILQETYGYFIYQEQIQKVVEVLAGYNDHEADDFRKTISKKIHEKMPKEKERFTKKSLESGMTKEEVDELWDQMESFASYCFNKSHALAYSVLTVKTAWLKAHYPTEFYAANIIHEMHAQEKVTELILEASELGISVLPPDINESQADFAVINNKIIRFGLGGIANVGVNTAEQIIADRNTNGKYNTISDLIYRTNIRSNVLENMIKGGCFDSLAQRSQLLYSYGENDTYINRLVELVRYISSKELIPLNAEEEWMPLPVVAEYSKMKLAEMEKEMNGLYLEYNPLQILKPQIDQLKRDNKGLLVGYPSDYVVFKSGKGCAFMLDLGNGQTHKVLVTGQTWSRLKGYMSDYMKDIVCTEGNSFKDDVMFTRNVMPLKNKIRDFKEDVVIRLPLNFSGMAAISKIADKINIDGGSKLFARLQGKNFSAKYLVGNIN
jgi:DNA polymerase-3 subunit alpha